MGFVYWPSVGRSICSQFSHTNGQQSLLQLRISLQLTLMLGFLLRYPELQIGQ